MQLQFSAFLKQKINIALHPGILTLLLTKTPAWIESIFKYRFSGFLCISLESRQLENAKQRSHYGYLFLLFYKVYFCIFKSYIAMKPLFLNFK